MEGIVLSTDRSKDSTDKEEEGTDKDKDSTVSLYEGIDDRTKARSATPIPSTTTLTMFGDDETIAQVLLNMSQAKAISREKEKGVELKDVEESERPRPNLTRSLLTLKPLPKIDLKDKGKKIIEEEDESDTEYEDIPKAEKKFKQLARDEEMARKVQEDWEAEEKVKKLAEEEATKDALSNKYDFIQARIEADRLLALRLQDKEKEQFTIEERAKFLHDTIAAQRRFLAEQRAIAIINKPLTRTQLRNQMMIYLKHVGNKKHSDLKSKTFEEIQALYEKVKRFDESFTAVGSTEDERRIKEMNEGVKDTDQKRLKELELVEDTSTLVLQLKRNVSLLEGLQGWKKIALCQKNKADLLGKDTSKVGIKVQLLSLKDCTCLRNTNNVNDSELASLFGKLKYKENLIDSIYETKKKKSLATKTPLSTPFFSSSFVQDFQDSPDDEEDTRCSQEYLNDLEEEYQERSLLAKSKRFFKKESQRFSSAKVTDDTICHKCGRKGKDTKLSIPGVERPWLSEAEGFTLPNHDTGRILPPDTQVNITDPSVAITNSSTTKYDSADESLVCSTPLPLIEKLAGTELVSRPKTLKSILKSNSTFKAKTLKGVTINELSSPPTKGSKNVSSSKINSAPVGKLKNVKTKDDIPLSIVPQYALQNKYKTQFKKNYELRGLNNHLFKNCYKVLFCNKCERTDHRTCDHVEYMSTINMSQHLKGQGGSSSISKTSRPSKPFHPCIHY
ncbi:hypothetical protein Tco_0446173, partial [Tanacetum coccineum]